MKIAASLMCADVLHLEQDIRELEEAGVDFWHIDIMDGVFVPNLAMNFDTVKAIKTISNIPMDAHLMVNRPEDFVQLAAEAGIDWFSFHLERSMFPVRLIDEIKRFGMKAGVVLNPSTSLERIPYVLDRVDYVVIMTVEPGFAGQKFVDGVLPKISQLAQMIRESGREIPIEVDGNINVVNAQRTLAAGAEILVGGTSSIFHNGGTLTQNLAQFKQAVLGGRSDE